MSICGRNHKQHLVSVSCCLPSTCLTENKMENFIWYKVHNNNHINRTNLYWENIIRHTNADDVGFSKKYKRIDNMKINLNGSVLHGSEKYNADMQNHPTAVGLKKFNHVQKPIAMAMEKIGLNSKNDTNFEKNSHHNPKGVGLISTPHVKKHTKNNNFSMIYSCEIFLRGLILWLKKTVFR